MLRKHFSVILAFLAATALGGCTLSEKAMLPAPEEVVSEVLSVQSLLAETSSAKVDITLGFPDAVADAVRIDPQTHSARQAVLVGSSSLDELRAQLQPQISGRVYAGIQDVDAGDAGAAATLNLSQIVFDGGILDNRISAANFEKQAAFENYRSVLNQRAFDATVAWIDLNRYERLNRLIKARLEVLNPLINQLEQVASAGIGDATTVASAKRQVTMIRVTETQIQEQYQQAREKFTRTFGQLPRSSSYDASLILKAVPSNVSDASVMASPAVMQAYNRYMSAEASARAVEARKSVSMSLEGALTEPADGSPDNSSASVGFVLRKNLYDGGALEAQIEGARQDAEGRRSLLEGAFREILEKTQDARQTITATRASVELARENAKIAREEIDILRKQLSIGQSTLSSVLQAEARLYDAEANMINFTTNGVIAQVTLLSVIGRLSETIGIDAGQELLGEVSE